MIKLNKDVLFQNVKNYKEEKRKQQQEEEDARYKRELLKIEPYLDTILKNMEKASLEGKERYELIVVKQVEYISTIVRYFKELGFDVELKVQPIMNYTPVLEFSSVCSFKYKIIIRWDK